MPRALVIGIGAPVLALVTGLAIASAFYHYDARVEHGHRQYATVWGTVYDRYYGGMAIASTADQATIDMVGSRSVGEENCDMFWYGGWDSLWVFVSGTYYATSSGQAMSIIDPGMRCVWTHWARNKTTGFWYDLERFNPYHQHDFQVWSPFDDSPS